MRESSLQQRVARWLLPPLLVLVAINAAMTYQGALDAVNRAYDRSLSASIKSIAERIHSLEGEISVDVPYSAFEVFEAGVQERVYYAVIGPDGRTVTGYDDLVPPPALRDQGALMLGDTTYRGNTVRIGVYRKRLYDPALSGGDFITVVFAETTESRVTLARELFLDSIRRQLLLVALGAVMLAMALTSAFKPLIRLRDTVRARQEDDLSPMDRAGIPTEVQPLIDAINRHTERLSAMLAARRRFFADAAHQIRTPLAVLTTQAEYGQRQLAPDEMRRTFQGLMGTIRSTRRMADQMLALSHAESAEGKVQAKQAVALSRLVREIALELAPVALDKHIALAFEEGGAACIQGDPQMLRELVANLIDNAIRYSPPDTQVELATRVEGDEAVLSVCDQGPGIPVEERDKVFQRFYRILAPNKAPGSGLGLPIVREIALAHGGTVQLETAVGGGLCVRVGFPAYRRGA
ncbi:sensor histidine kinase [Denitromonas iodatirespirans]|uniref:histidine kinase n=1 Tax=Denitromonas iodatirespirans TaxID=2795389 RepID=A0A944DFR0_DENI1|nr:sensor histidine kinase [Denitromonas iodatirespirans]MBT0961983.1 sensor histidine kinase N-terminal domain-containing protein [Denitromonas iodatirespirans]